MSKVKNLKKLNNLKNNPPIKTQTTENQNLETDNAILEEDNVENTKAKPKLEPESNVSKAAEVALLQIQLEAKDLESKDWQAKAFRYVADLENYKKQQELETAQTKKNTKKNAIKPLLEYLNNQYLALNFIKEITDEKTTKALAMFRTSFDKLVVEYKMQGVELILPNQGDEFDPVIMQALAPTNDEHAKVKHIVSLGLKIDNQLIQPVMVVL